MLQTFRNAWRIEELRKKILFTLLIVLLYRLGNAVPVPFVDTKALADYFQASGLQNTILGLFNVMSGGAFSQATIFALSIQPYINASIIIQLLCIAIPALERLQKEGGEEGKKKIASITRYSTVAIGLLQGFAYYMMMRNYSLINADFASNVWAAIVIILTFTSGSALSIEIADETIIERMSGRRTCKDCSATFHIVSNPPKVEGKCDFCGGELTIRKDDAPETVKARLDVYHAETEPLKDFYAQRGKLVKVDNQPTIEATTAAIEKALGLE